jgi:hypothetical protein
VRRSGARHRRPAIAAGIVRIKQPLALPACKEAIGTLSDTHACRSAPLASLSDRSWASAADRNNQ